MTVIVIIFWHIWIGVICGEGVLVCGLAFYPLEYQINFGLRADWPFFIFNVTCK